MPPGAIAPGELVHLAQPSQKLLDVFQLALVDGGVAELPNARCEPMHELLHVWILHVPALPEEPSINDIRSM